MPSIPSDDPPDDQLLQRVAAGDEEGFILLFRRRRDDVFRFAMHMTASKSTAEDVTQDVFMAVMRDAARYDASRATVKAWLYGITRNFVRRRASHLYVEPLDDDALASVKGPCVAAGNDPLANLTRAEEITTIRRA